MPGTDRHTVTITGKTRKTIEQFKKQFQKDINLLKLKYTTETFRYSIEKRRYQYFYEVEYVTKKEFISIIKILIKLSKLIKHHRDINIKYHIFRSQGCCFYTSKTWSTKKNGGWYYYEIYPGQKEMEQGFSIILGDKNGKNRTTYDPDYQTKYDQDNTIFRKHTDINNNFICALAHLIQNSPQRIIWVGQKSCEGNEEDANGISYYVLNKEKRKRLPNIEIPMYNEAWSIRRNIDLDNGKLLALETNFEKVKFEWRNTYILNHDTKEYIDMNHYIKNNTKNKKTGKFCVCPIPVLTSTDNTKSSDFSGRGRKYLGIWAWNLISISTIIPNGYTEFAPILKK